MKFNFMISIVIPVYNAKNKMAKCLNSLINQSSNNFEVIFIDDCSTDGSYEYLKKFFKNAKTNVKIHQNEKNSGPGVSRNNGIKMAEGKYLMFIDSDDYITNDCIENLSKIISDNSKIDCICFDFYRVNGKQIQENKMISKSELKNMIDTKEAFLYSKGTICGKLFDLDIIRNNKIYLPNLKRNEDMPFAKVVLSYCNNIFYCQKPLYFYVAYDSSLMHNVQLLDENNAIKAYEFIENNVSFLMSDYLEQIFIKECLYSVISGVMQKGYTKKKILSITLPLEKKYNSWYNNSYIKELNFKNRVVLTLYHYRMFFLLKFVFYLKKKIYKY